MLKKTLFPVLYAIAFLGSSTAFWYFLDQLYQTPFIWMEFNFALNQKLIPIGVSVIGTIIAASLLTIFKPHPLFHKITFILGALIGFLFLPQTEFTFLCICIFAAGFLIYERATTDTFHSFIKIQFWETYSHTIPGLLTAFAFCVAIGSYQASSLAINDFRIAIPDSVLEQTIRMFQPAQPQNQINPEVQAVLDQLGGVLPNETIEDVNQRIFEQTKLQIEGQINSAVDQYKPFIPFLSAAAIFFFFNILNFPVLILSTALVSLIMKVLTVTKVISIVTVKMDVERFAW